MNCREIRDHLELYLQRDLPDEQMRAVEAHLGSCAACREELEAARALLEALDGHLAWSPAPDVADRVVDGVLRRRTAGRLARVGAAAAAVAAGVIAGFVLWPTGRTPVPVPGGALAGRVRPVGQATFERVGPRRVRLRSGELYVAVDPGAGGFVIETPAATATALGTRFYVRARQTKGEGEMNARHLTTVLVVAGAVQLANPWGSATGSAGEALAAAQGSAPKKHAADLAARFAQYHEPVRAGAKPAVPAYRLPLDLKRIANFADAAGKLGLNADEPLLRKNGFVVMALPRWIWKRDDIVQPYKDLKVKGVPVFVTADTLLHLYHVQFDETLKDVEEREFFDDVLSLSQLLAAESAEQYASSTGEQRDAARLLQAYSTVGMALLEGLGDAELRKEAEGMRKTVSAWEIGQSATRAQRQYLTQRRGKIEQILDGKELSLYPWPKGVAQLREHLAAFIKRREAAAASIPKAIAADVRAELALIGAHEGFEASSLFGYKEDYSQYVPRGHYTRSAKLRKYFLAMMWYGRMTFLLRGGEPYGPGDEPFLISEQDARKQTLAAAMLTRALNEEKLPGGRSARDVWERIYTVTAFYVGLADDLGAPEYGAAFTNAFGARIDEGTLAKRQNLRRFQVELAKFSPPAIYGGTGAQRVDSGAADPDALLRALHKATGLRLMGRRFVPDSYITGQLVYPTVGKPNGRADMFTASPSPAGPVRGFARGLDVMAVLGSPRARRILTELRDDDFGRNAAGGNLRYDVVFGGLKAEFDELSESDWWRNAYWAWLHSLKPLTAEFGAGYPTFMTTPAWRDKSLTTALASWSQLRHDTILYAKQSYGMGAGGMPPKPKPVEGYVEPVPEFYARMLALTRMTRKGLADMKVAAKPAVERLAALEGLLERLLDISRKELAHRELTKDDYDFIRSFGEKLKYVQVPSAGRTDWRRREQLNEAMKTTLVADVHTDQNSKKVLEEATGYVDLIVVCYLQPDGRLVVGAGPVLSYYEFKQPMSDRLTDEKWRAMLKSGTPPHRPEWVKSYLRE